ncbi:MAG: T9SS type A sorting domain-containing protein [Lentimicrobium sp.]|jgi:hypothetical protein|nr:T9SS type A sorting domain-containing protein [Lentimicrobium sp.]
MKTFQLTKSILLSVLLLASSFAFSQNSFINSSFETPAVDVSAANYHGITYRPTGATWSFENGAGICHNGCDWGAMVAPDGVQFAFIQGDESSSFYQTVTLDPGNYAITFNATLGSGDSQTVKVTIDGSPLSDITITSSYPTFDLYRTNSFNVATSGTHVIKFAGAVAGDNKAFIDQIYISNANSAYIENPGYEAPQISENSVGGSYGGWTYNANSGIQKSTVGWWPVVPYEGTQAAWMQFNGTVSRKIYLPNGTFNIGLYARRLNSDVQSIKVKLDGVQIGSDIEISEYFERRTTSDFTATAGFHILSFEGTALTSATAFLDGISVDVATHTSVQNAENKLNEISIYPNPVKEYLNINAFGNDIIVEIFNLSGILLTKQKTNVDQIHLKNLTSGTYLLKVTDANGISQNKLFIKE